MQTKKREEQEMIIFWIAHPLPLLSFHPPGASPLQKRSSSFSNAAVPLFSSEEHRAGILNFQGNGKQNVTVHGEKGADYQKRTKRGRTIKNIVI